MMFAADSGSLNGWLVPVFEVQKYWSPSAFYKNQNRCRCIGDSAFWPGRRKFRSEEQRRRWGLKGPRENPVFNVAPAFTEGGRYNIVPILNSRAESFGCCM